MELNNIKQQEKKSGDLGLLTQGYSDVLLCGKKIHKLEDVVEQITQIQTKAGKGSTDAKKILITGLLQRCTDPLELRYIGRTFQGSLRIGVKRTGIQTALIQSLETFKDQQSAKQLIQQLEETVFMSKFLTQHKFDTKSVSVGLPVNFMLGKAVRTFKQLKKTIPTKAGVQRKYDGQRSQVHYKNGEVSLFSRSFESQNVKYEPLKENIAKELNKKKNIKNCILDGEILLIEGKDKILTFQELLREKDRFKQGRSLRYVAFDMLMLNDEPQIEIPFIDRIKLVNQFITKSTFIEPIVTQFVDLSQEQSKQQIEKLIQNAKNQNTQGLFVKSESSLYDTSGGRKSWVKLKYSLQDGNEAVADTLDLVPVGAYYGRGKRQSFYGSFLLATYNPKLKKFEAICKIGTGFSDQFLEKCTERLKRNKSKKFPQKVVLNQKIDTPDEWLSPSEVWEVRSDLISKSKKYFLHGPDKQAGLSLRFPAFVSLRSDKSVDQATSSEQVIDLSKN